MRCPKCGCQEDKVIDSRASREGATIRRRRECEKCHHRFTTYEEVEHEGLMVLKRDGRREEFSREKLLAGIDSTGRCVLHAIDGGKTQPIRGTLPDDDLIQWSSDGRFLYVRAAGDSSLDFFRVNLATGVREAWKKIEPADKVGLIGIQSAAVHMTPDGKSVAYSYWKTLTELYVVDNLK